MYYPRCWCFYLFVLRLIFLKKDDIDINICLDKFAIRRIF